MVNYARAALRSKTPQSQPIEDREQEMEKNAAGGYGFVLNPMQRLRRFLILGTDGGCFYASEQKLTKENFKSIKEAITKFGVATVDEIIRVSDEGLAPKNKPALFALACAAAYGDNATRTRALNGLHKVARTGSDLLYFASQINELRGWGRALRRAVANWFTKMPVERLTTQAMKYRQREGWALSDLLRLSHPQTTDKTRNAIFAWLLKDKVTKATPAQLHWMSESTPKEGREALTEREIAAAVKELELPREALPTEALNSVEVWKALLEKMPPHAMVRNLGKMTSIGVLKPLNKVVGKVTETLLDAEMLKKARMHPLPLLVASYVYGLGKGIKGTLSWEPVSAITDGLTHAFYSSFDETSATQKSVLIGVDVSGSMTQPCVGMESVSAATGAAMLALALRRVMPNSQTLAFDTGVKKFNIPANASIDTVLKNIGHGGGTDCAQPFLYAKKEGLEPDAIVVITDNESWAGKQHAVEMIEKLRRKGTLKVILVAMSATRTSIGDVHPDNLEAVGFDASLAKLIVDFVEGRV